MTVDYSILGRKLVKLYPYLAKELLTIPDLTDLVLIDDLYSEYCSIQSEPQTKSQQTNHRIVFIAAIIKLFDPDALEYRKNMKNGLRQKLSSTLHCHPTIISDNFTNVRNYIKIYPDFSNEVAYIYHELKMYADGNKDQSCLQGANETDSLSE